tara:strand:- start:1321 stop:1677 length:357 start_codon:yes stop_codon:yes gene_type:complete
MKEKEITKIDYHNNYKPTNKDRKIEEISEIIHETRKWAFNVMGDEYMKQMHNRTKEEDYGGYAIGKFKMMQDNFGDWYASLDDNHRYRLASIIHGRIYNNELTRWENGLMFPKESEAK